MAIHYTPEEISEILNEYFSGITHKQYIGARYVPIFGRKDEDSIEWDNTGTYEPLTIVLYQGNSFTSRQFVPVGIDINNNEFWAETGNYNAQIELYRQEVLEVEDTLTEKAFSFETVGDMKDAENLFVGAICHTNGFHASGDGGAAWYVITNTGTANEIDVIACGDLIANLIVSNEVNACALGCKNDGSADCADIINYATQKYVIYFPIGKYKVNSPIYLKNSVKGAIYNRMFYRNEPDDNNACIILSGLTGSSASSVGVINVTTIDENLDSITIENLAIKCNNVEYGINIATTQASEIVYINKVLVYNCATIGINCTASAGNSRQTFINDTSIWHKLNSPETFNNSVGLYIGTNVYDCFFTNIEIMGFKRGVSLLNGGSLSRISNMHIWTYPIDYIGSFDTAWTDSIGLLLGDGTDTLIENIYLDTCYTPINVFSNATSKIVNCYVFYGTPDTIAINNRPVVIIPNTATAANGNINIVNMFVHDRHGVANRIFIDPLTTEKYYFNVDHLTVRSPMAFSTGYQLCVENSQFTVNPGGNGYEEIAAVRVSSGFVRLELFNRYGYSMEVMIFKTGSDVTVYNMSKTVTGVLTDIFYKVDGDIVKLFSSTSTPITVKPIANSCTAFIQNYNNFRGINGEVKTRETGVAAGSLTALTSYWA